MIRRFVQCCTELQHEIQGLPADRAARLRNAASDPDTSPRVAVENALGPEVDPSRVVSVTGTISAIAELAPGAIRALAIPEPRDWLAGLDDTELTAVAPVVASHARRAGAGDRTPAASVLSALAPRLRDENATRLVRRVLRQLFLAGPSGVSAAALPGLLDLGVKLSADDQLLGRVDLLLAFRWRRELVPPLGRYLTSDEAARDTLLTQGREGAAPDRWRAAHLLRCLPGQSAGLDAVALCSKLLMDESVRVWRAAGSSLGHLAVQDPRARRALLSFLDPSAPIGHRRHGAAGLGSLFSADRSVSDEAIRDCLKRGSDPWLVASLAFSLPDLAESDLEVFADLVGRLVAAPRKATLVNLARVLGDLAEQGKDEIQQATSSVIASVKDWRPRDPGQAALRWAALDALRLTGLDAPPALGSCCRLAARLALDENEGEVPRQVQRALDQGYAQLRRIDEMDVSAGIEGRGRLLFEIHDLGRALFEEDLLFSVLRTLKREGDGEVAALEAEYEQLRLLARTRLLGNIAAMDAYDLPRRTEVARGVTLALDGRSSGAGSLEARLGEQAARAVLPGGFDALRAVARRPERPVRRMAAAGLARQLDYQRATSPEALFNSVLRLSVALPDVGLLDSVALAASYEVASLVQQASSVLREWAGEPDHGGQRTVEALRQLGEACPEGELGTALLDLAEVVDHLGDTARVEDITAPHQGATPPLVRLARSTQAVNAALSAADEVAQPEERGETVTEVGQRLGELADRVTEMVQRLRAERPSASLESALELERAVDRFLADLRAAVSLPVAAGVESALERWRDALEQQKVELAAAVEREVERQGAHQKEELVASVEEAMERQGARQKGDLAAAVDDALERQAGKRQALHAELAAGGEADRRPQVPRTVGPGRRIGDYELVERLGIGGMGVVYKARQVSLDRYVAFKIMGHGVSADPDSVERFKREARTMGRWCHDNILRVIGLHEDPFPYLVMEYVDGESVAQLLESSAGSIAPARAATICADVAGALAHAHGEGVIHRDVSAGNVMIRSDGRVVLMDFGVALLSDQARLSVPGAILGGWDYMSPEQCGSGGEVGPPADVYALGALLYQLLSGELPIKGGTPGEMAARKAAGVVLSLASRCPRLPVGLCALVQRMLDVDPGARPTAVEVAGALSEQRRELVHLASETTEPAGVANLGRQELYVLCLLLRNIEAIEEPGSRTHVASWWYQHARAAIEQAGGISDRHVSGRVYGYFGHPDPSPDDGERAVRAIESAHSGVRRAAQSSGVPLSLRAGLARGPALVGRVENAAPSLVVAGAVVDRAEALARSDLGEADVRADQAAFSSTAGKVAYQQTQAMDRTFGRIFFMQPRLGQC